MYTAYTDFVLKSLQCLRKFAGRKRELKDSCIEYLLKIYFCFAWQNRLGLCAAVKISSEVNWVCGGGILKHVANYFGYKVWYVSFINNRLCVDREDLDWLLKLQKFRILGHLTRGAPARKGLGLRDSLNSHY